MPGQGWQSEGTEWETLLALLPPPPPQHFSPLPWVSSTACSDEDASLGSIHFPKPTGWIPFWPWRASQTAIGSVPCWCQSYLGHSFLSHCTAQLGYQGSGQGRILTCCHWSRMRGRYRRKNLRGNDSGSGQVEGVCHVTSSRRGLLGTGRATTFSGGSGFTIKET